MSRNSLLPIICVFWFQTVSYTHLEKCGYLDGDLLPLSKERAYELMERDLTVYIVQEGENCLLYTSRCV